MSMGLLHTLHYLDFSQESWKVISSNPAIFEAVADDIILNIRDISHKEHRLRFKKGGRIEYIRSIGKYILRWDEKDLMN